MSTLVLKYRSETQALYTTIAVLGKTNRLRMHDALRAHYGERFLGFTVHPRNEDKHYVHVEYTPEAPCS